MADKSTVNLEAEPLGDIILPSVAPVAPLENFQNPTANIRVLDQAQQNIVGVTREGRSAIADAFFSQGMGYGWQMSKISNGQETDPGYGSNVLGKADTYGFGTEAAPEVVRVTPSFALEVINNNQLKITWSNMNTSQGACWFRCGWLGDRIVWNPEGTTTINVPNTTGDPKFDQIGVTGPWGELWTGITYRIQGGHFTQTPSSSNYTFAGWAAWNRTLPNDDIGTSGIENHGGDKTIGNVTLHTHEVLVHPGKSEDVAFTWTSQAAGTASIQAILQDARAGMGDGVRYTIQRIKADGTETTTLSSGVIVDGGNLGITEGALSVAVGVGDKIKLIVCAKGTGTDPNDDKWDTIRVVKLEVKLTEAEKTYEKVTVAPSIQLRTTNNGNTLFVDYRNMPEGMKLRAMRRGIQWNDGDWGKTEVSLPQGSGSSWVSFNAWSGDISVYPVDIWLVDANSDNEPIEEKKLSFTMQGNTSSPLSGVPTTRIIVGSRANDVLKDPEVARTSVDLAEELAVTDYTFSLTQTPPVRDWAEGQTFDPVQQARNFGVILPIDFNHDGPLHGNGGHYKIMYTVANTMYQKHQAWSDGGVYIERLWYWVKNDMKKLPQEYWVRNADGSIITKPNCPHELIYEISLNGTYTGGPVGGTSDSIDALLPIEGQHISGGIEKLEAQPAAPEQEGFGPMILSFREGQSPTFGPGTMIKVICQFQSIGTLGGPITVRTYGGYTGNPAQDQLQHTFTTDLAVYGRKSLTFNAYAPLPGPGGNDPRGIVTVEVQYADGHKEILGQRHGKAYGMSADEAAAQAAQLAAAYREAMKNARANTVRYFQTIGQAIPSSFYDDIATTNDIRLTIQKLITDGIGGGVGDTLKVTGAWNNEQQIATIDALSWYNPSQAVPGLNESRVTISSQTLLGRILKGFLQQYQTAQTSSAKNTLTAKLSDLTGIAAEKFAVLDGASSTSSRVVALKKLLSEGQYSSVFSNQSPQNLVTFAATNKFNGHTPLDPDIDIYRDFSTTRFGPDMSVKVRFDIQPPVGVNSYDHVDAYLIDAMNGVELGRITPTSIKDGLFVSIPLQRLVPFATEHLNGGPGTDIRTGQFIVKLVAWFSNQQGAPGYAAQSSVFSFQHDALHAPETPLGDVDLSLLPSSNTLKQSEVEYLRRLQFPMDGNDWHYGIESPFHKNAGLYALDFNGTNDQGRTVYAPISGKISAVDLKSGQVTIETTLPTGKKALTTFYHLIDILENATGLQYEGIEEAIRRLDLKARFATEINSYVQTHGGVPMTSTVFAAIQTIPSALAELQPTITRIDDVQAAITSMIGNGLTIGAKDILAACGNEGQSTGSHVHEEASIEGNPVSLFAWVNAWRNGIEALTDQNNLIFKFDVTIGALVNNENKLVILRKQENNAGVNAVYAWTSGFNRDNEATQERVLWKHEINGHIVDAWVKASDLTKKWNTLTREWQNI